MYVNPPGVASHNYLEEEIKVLRLLDIGNEALKLNHVDNGSQDSSIDAAVTLEEAANQEMDLHLYGEVQRF